MSSASEENIWRSPGGAESEFLAKRISTANKDLLVFGFYIERIHPNGVFCPFSYEILWTPIYTSTSHLQRCNVYQNHSIRLGRMSVHQTTFLFPYLIIGWLVQKYHTTKWQPASPYPPRSEPKTWTVFQSPSLAPEMYDFFLKSPSISLYVTQLYHCISFPIISRILFPAAITNFLLQRNMTEKKTVW